MSFGDDYIPDIWITNLKIILHTWTKDETFRQDVSIFHLFSKTSLKHQAPSILRLAEMFALEKYTEKNIYKYFMQAAIEAIIPVRLSGKVTSTKYQDKVSIEFPTALFTLSHSCY